MKLYLRVGNYWDSESNSRTILFTTDDDYRVLDYCGVIRPQSSPINLCKFKKLRVKDD